jgi:hypothetical protein
MAGMSDSRNVDDVRLHLEMVVQANAARGRAVEGESAEAKAQRESAVLRAKLLERVEAALRKVSEEVPGLTLAETKKLLKTRAGRDALALGKAALARVDDHLQSVTGQRNPIEGKRYGVYGANPTSFTGVLRALGLSIDADARAREVAEGSAERELAFTPYVASEVRRAYEALAGVVGERVTSRADLRRAVAAKDESLTDALGVLSAVRAHLYANLPDRKEDDDLRDYGFTPVQMGARGARKQDDDEEDEDREREEPKPAPAPAPVEPKG